MVAPRRPYALAALRHSNSQCLSSELSSFTVCGSSRLWQESAFSARGGADRASVLLDQAEAKRLQDQLKADQKAGNKEAVKHDNELLKAQREKVKTAQETVKNLQAGRGRGDGRGGRGGDGRGGRGGDGRGGRGRI